jgi:hypothetical protein
VASRDDEREGWYSGIGLCLSLLPLLLLLLPLLQPLLQVAAAVGCHCFIAMPDDAAIEKSQLLQALGVPVILWYRVLLHCK